MPLKSKAQARKFGAMYRRGEISKATLDRSWAHTKKKYSQLPERVKRKKTRKKKRRKRRRRRVRWHEVL